MKPKYRPTLDVKVTNLDNKLSSSSCLAISEKTIELCDPSAFPKEKIYRNDTVPEETRNELIYCMRDNSVGIKYKVIDFNEINTKIDKSLMRRI